MKKLLSIIGLLVVAIGAFYGGFKYGQSKISSQPRFMRLGEGANVLNGAGRNMRSAGGAGFVSGEIISTDDKSLILKIRDGGSKIVFLSGSTSVQKSVEGSLVDLQIGEQVMAQGISNLLSSDQLAGRTP